jgi:hypothetical protein
MINKISFILRSNRVQMNTLQVNPLHADLLEMITNTRSVEFERACSTSEMNLDQQFFDRVVPDMGAKIDERDLGVRIWNVVNDLSQECRDHGDTPIKS